MASDSLGIFTLTRLRFLLSFLPGPHHAPWQLNCTMSCVHVDSQQQSWVAHARKTQFRNMLVPTCTSTQSNQSQTTSTFLHDVSLRFVGNSGFWMPFRPLQISLHHHRETYENSEQAHKLHIMQNMFDRYALWLRKQRELWDDLRILRSKTIPNSNLSQSGMAPF